MSILSVHRRRLALRPPQRQRGATLVIALLILVLIMIIGVTAVSTSDTQFKLAGNLQFEDSALNNAEAAIATGERWLGTSPNHTNPGFTAAVAATPHLLPRLVVRPVARDAAPLTMAWTDADSLSVGGTNQRYIIEQMSVNSKLAGASQVVGGRVNTACNQVNTYLVTARGVSARGATKLVQSYYSVLNCS